MTVQIEGFHRTGDDNRSVSFVAAIRDPAALEKYLRYEEGICGAYDADQVVLLLDRDGHMPGNCMGTVALICDDDHPLLTVERAIHALQSVRDGLREAGHADWDRPA
jgi:hypothetical protein